MKTYCISDIHGHLNELKDFTKTLSKDDKVYVLGDAVDKGPDSIKTLQFIMKDKRFHMILGNHDYMMFRYITASNDYVKDVYQENWIDLNQGGPTYKEFKALKKETRDKIINFLSNLPLSYEITVNKRKFLLTHADPYVKKGLKAKDDESLVEDIVWRRILNYGQEFCKNKIVVVGHTPVQLLFKNYEAKPYYETKSIDKAHIIVIDGGLAVKERLNGKLIAFCLDDLKYKTY